MRGEQLFAEGKTMDITLRKSGPGDGKLISSMLTAANLPVESLDNRITTFYMAEEDGKVIGMAGMEIYGEEALLRSVTVLSGMRDKGYGSMIVDRMLDEARNANVRSVILLTETARDFFLKKGFSVVERSGIDNAEMKRSSEFTFACPKSAVCMKLELASH